MPDRYRIIAILLLAAVLLAACSGTPSATPTEAPTDPVTPPAPTATPEPPSQLTVCLGKEPLGLYLYGGSSRAQWSVLEAVYDGPIDRRGYSDQPVILTQLPSTENGGDRVAAVPVQRGQMVLAADGNIAPLDTGLTVLPAGCTDETCAVAWDGAALEMDQQQLTFRLLDGLKWSDGAPLTAADSVYSFQVASDPVTPVNPLALDRTESYTALDETTVVWTGVPGYRTTEPSAYFFIPLPQHAYGTWSAADLLTNETSNRTPLGWGPYIIESWTSGETIELARNPHYFRAGEGLPRFDRLTYRFIGDHADNILAALVEGECDIVDETTLLEEQLQSVRNTTLNGRIQTFISLGPDWEHLDFGVRPAAYDAGLNPFLVTRQDFFGDLRVRQAVSACIDRPALVSELLYNQSQVPVGFFPPDHPLYAADLPQIAYDPAYGAQLLDQAGWLDHDSDPTTPRQAAGVANVLDGAEFSVIYSTTPEKLRVSTASRIAQMLGDCGIKVTVQPLDAGTLYAPGPQGVLFGRNFDLAQFAWQSGRGSPCFLYTDEQIPANDNGWLGANITGWSDPAYDAACQAALAADPVDAASVYSANRAIQEQFAQQLPALPLYYTIHLTAARPEICSLQVDSSARSEFWNLEDLASGNDCP
ncbi:MAG: peptide ABC transporter substrate-binding protein [Bellilinea sp.]